MADTSKDGLLLGVGIRHVTATSQFTRGSKQYCFNALIFGNMSSCLCETIFNCSSVLILSWSWSKRSYTSAVLLIYGRHYFLAGAMVSVQGAVNLAQDGLFYKEP